MQETTELGDRRGERLPRGLGGSIPAPPRPWTPSRQRGAGTSCCFQSALPCAWGPPSSRLVQGAGPGSGEVLEVPCPCGCTGPTSTPHGSTPTLQWLQSAGLGTLTQEEPSLTSTAPFARPRPNPAFPWLLKATSKLRRERPGKRLKGQLKSFTANYKKTEQAYIT